MPVFQLKLEIELRNQGFQFSNMPPLREEAPLESVIAASGHGSHGIDNFTIRSHQGAVEAIAIPQRQSRLQVTDNNDVGQKIVCHLAITLLDRYHLEQRSDDFRFPERQRAMLPSGQLQRNKTASA